jgi:hypothetical protein
METENMVSKCAHREGTHGLWSSPAATGQSNDAEHPMLVG